MGKHQIGQLQPYELVITIMISELAALPMQDTEISLLNGVIPIVTLLFIQATLSLLSLKNERFRILIDGKPNILINKGQINIYELTKLRFTIDDLLEKLRLKNFHSITDVEYAILETNGDLSVIPKSVKRPVCPEDLQLNPAPGGPSTSLIIDGCLQTDNLKLLNLNESWLLKELVNRGIPHWDNVFFASIDFTGNLFIQVKNPVPEQEK